MSKPQTRHPKPEIFQRCKYIKPRKISIPELKIHASQMYIFCNNSIIFFFELGKPATGFYKLTGFFHFSEKFFNRILMQKKVLWNSNNKWPNYYQIQMDFEFSQFYIQDALGMLLTSLFLDSAHVSQVSSISLPSPSQTKRYFFPQLSFATQEWRLEQIESSIFQTNF